jgi:hypothetical protein
VCMCVCCAHVCMMLGSGVEGCVHMCVWVCVCCAHVCAHNVRCMSSMHTGNVRESEAITHWLVGWVAVVTSNENSKGHCMVIPPIATRERVGGYSTSGARHGGGTKMVTLIKQMNASRTKTWRTHCLVANARRCQTGPREGVDVGGGGGAPWVAGLMSISGKAPRDSTTDTTPLGKAFGRPGTMEA